MLTVREVLAIGDDLGLPYDLVHKTPADGMSGKSDEEKIGFTYEELDNYLLIENKAPSREVLDKITKMHEANKHKLLPMPMFNPNEEETI
jgi:NAD+ synthase